jgi:hypothetical protein
MLSWPRSSVVDAEVRIGLTQTTDFGFFVGSFFALRAKKEPTKEEKYDIAYS